MSRNLLGFNGPVKRLAPSVVLMTAVVVAPNVRAKCSDEILMMDEFAALLPVTNTVLRLGVLAADVIHFVPVPVLDKI